MHRWVKALFLIIVVLLSPLLAQEKIPLGPDGRPLGRMGHEIEVRYLYPSGRFYNYETPFPLVLEYQNLTTEPQYFVMDWELDSAVPEEYKVIKLDPKGKKQIPLLLPTREASQLYQLTINEQGVSANLQSQSQTRVTGLLTADSKNLDYIRSLQLEKNPYFSASQQNQSEEKEYQVLAALSELDHQVFPEHWGMLKSLDVLICYDLNALNLSDEQYLSLVRWVRDGGRLVLVSNGLPGEFKGRPLNDILPFQPTDTISKDDGIFVTGTLVDGAQVIAEHEALPLLVGKDVQDGHVFFITTPLVDLSLLGKEQTQDLWRPIFDTVPPGQNAKLKALDYAALDNIPELPRTQAGWVALFVILYGIVVGPINLTILRKKDKMLYAFATVPLVALLFASSAYMVNRFMRPSDPVLRELGWLELQTGALHGTAEGEQILFSPNATIFTIKSDETTMFDLYRSHYRNKPRQLSVFELTSDYGLKSSIELGTWDVQRFNSMSVIDLNKPISVEVDFQNNSKAEVSVSSPLESDGVSAIVASSAKGFSSPFKLKAGQHKYSVSLTPNSYVSAHLDFPKEEYPGRNDLVDRVWNKLNLNTNKTYLFFWTQDVSSPLEVSHGGVNRHDYLVTVEVTN